MAIKCIRLFHLKAPLPAPMGNALVTFHHRETLLVEIVDTDGLSGWGECWSASVTAAAVIKSQLAHKLLGKDSRRIGQLWYEMVGALGHGRQTTAMGAVAAIDIALHDLAGKREQVPISTLLGGAMRDRVTAYASGPFFKPDGHPYRFFEREIEGYLQEGYRAIKLRSGFSPRDDADMVHRARALIGDDNTLMVDFNQSYQPRTALAAASAMQEANLLWIEEPTTPLDLSGYRLLSTQLKPALAGGETFTSAGDFLPFLQSGCMDVLQPDLAVCGGITGTLKVAALAEVFGRPVVPHVWGSIVNFQAALHFNVTRPAHRSGATGDYPLMEYDGGPNALLDMCGRPQITAQGDVLASDAPGLGIELSPERFNAYIETYESVGE